MTGTTMQSILAGAMILMFFTAEAAQSRIYKTVDEHGNVVFTDVPPREDQTSEQIVVETPNSFAVEEALGDRSKWIVETDENGEEVGFTYDSLEIKSPKDDEAVRENAGNLTVVAVSNPRLQPGHRMRLLLDGVPVDSGRGSQYQLENLDRGTHTLVLEIIDDSEAVVMTSQTTTFHMLRHSIARQPRPGN